MKRTMRSLRCARLQVRRLFGSARSPVAGALGLSEHRKVARYPRGRPRSFHLMRPPRADGRYRRSVLLTLISVTLAGPVTPQEIDPARDGSSFSFLAASSRFKARSKILIFQFHVPMHNKACDRLPRTKARERTSHFHEKLTLQHAQTCHYHQ